MDQKPKFYFPIHPKKGAGENGNLEELFRSKQENIMVSYRGNAMRISSNVYNDESNFNRLIAQFD